MARAPIAIRLTDRLQFDSAVFRAMNNLIIEIRAAEGGDDAKALVEVQASIYSRLASRREL